jgi:hypothetical protein
MPAGPVYAADFMEHPHDGGASAVLGTLLGFIFAFAVVRCQIPGKRWVHLIA